MTQTTEFERFILEHSNWGNAIPENIAQILFSVIGEFENVLGIERLNSKKVLVLNSKLNPENLDVPIFYKRPDKDFNLIFLATEDNFWAQYIYQFSHEYCHHTINGDFNENSDRFGWLEESLCELSSLFIIRRMSKTWRIKPPYPNWSDYSSKLADYANEMISNKLKINYSFYKWLQTNIDNLYADRYLRKFNFLIAINILDIFENKPDLWRIIAYYKKVQTSDQMNLEQFLGEWKRIIPNDLTETFNILEKKLINTSC